MENQNHQIITASNDGEASPALSKKPLNDWNGPLTTFSGYTGVHPKQEYENQSWQDIVRTVCPDRPHVTTDKKSGEYYLPCLLKDAPLVGNTLKNAKKSGQPTVGKMRSKDHVMEATMIVVDIDSLAEEVVQPAIEKMKADGIAFFHYSSYSHGNPNKTGLRVRLIIPVDKPLDTDKYRKAYAGFDQHYFGGQIMKADASGANLYQQQGMWMTHPDWQEKAFKQLHEGGVASADYFVELGSTMVNSLVKSDEHKDYPPSDADKIAERCNQIGEFRDTKGANQSEPDWTNCLGVVGHCQDGITKCHDWSSGYPAYNRVETQKKLERRMLCGPTTCAQFKRTNPEGCGDCTESCHSPITLGRSDENRPNIKTAKTKIPTTSDDLVENVEPWSEPVNLGTLLDSTVSTIKQHIVISDDQAVAVALWIVMTWVVDQVEVLPLLIITAPEKACGKSQLLDIIALMAARSLSVSNISQAALYRCIEKAQPSLLIDEVDTFIRDKPEMMGIINAGHTRGSAHVIRSVGDMHEPKKFSVWCPKVLAGIALERHLKDATLSRGIVITMQRKLPGDRVQRLRHASRDRFTEIRRKCARFAQDSASMLAGARPILPEQLNDRQQDNWEPLLAIEGLAGSEWAQKANQAALAISEIDTEESIGVQLLSAIRSVFESHRVDKLPTSDLISKLCQDDEGPWSTYHRDKSITPRQLGGMLKKFGIQSRTTKFNGSSLKGYFLEDFAGAFARYLPPSGAPGYLPSPRNPAPEPMPAMASAVTDQTELTRNAIPLTGNLSEDVDF